MEIGFIGAIEGGNFTKIKKIYLLKVHEITFLSVCMESSLSLRVVQYFSNGAAVFKADTFHFGKSSAKTFD
jgi:hypothetical protein